MEGKVRITRRQICDILVSTNQSMSPSMIQNSSMAKSVLATAQVVGSFVLLFSSKMC